ncbi:transketolase [Pseudemcibacter aquimaris]|uniref:transketolase n=1 Tax=Pseudemcibacter aquimaris TaxID=2857064 RepID=UPI002012E6D3|nr:transketolase [Pseudemcibacter aquimaris]MCC3862174.1 transketolase [Pseudemcibacter aquimaris]WDU58927.1 transketolase [Pseudemcibacter aquimaris]
MTASKREMANAIRALSMDAVQAAKSGHPGMPMGMADTATVLFTEFMKFDPSWPEWPDRDRFILSAGHGSMLIYSLLYLTGYKNPTIEDIKNFRKLHQPCAGHPEFGEAPGIEMTTGPLGQGIATSVGFAAAEKLSAARMGDVVDHYTYVIAGDGCLMEGVSQEAISQAGHLKLGKLIVLWDDNSICIDGETDMTTSDDQLKRFEASNWHTIAVDGHDTDAVAAALKAAQDDDRPSLIACKTTIGYGSPNKGGTSATHGAPLGDEEIAATREFLNWPHDPFVVPDDVLKAWREAGARGASASAAWKEKFEALADDVKADFNRRLNKDLPADLVPAINAYKKDLAENPVGPATRIASQMALEVINPIMQETIGGSADLTGSNMTLTKDLSPIKPDDFTGRYMYYGVREFGMAAAMNGMALHGEYMPYGGTFMVFTDYCRPAIRLSALMEQRVVYVMSHDSIGLGEDGPTHQPIEHLASLRAMPNVNVFRPCDAIETAECWLAALEDKDTPSILVLTRQGLKQARLEHTDENLCAKGGYVISEASSDAKVTIIATGSEVEIAIEAQAELEADGTPTRVVSMPSTETFDAQPADYQDSVLGNTSVYASIEAGSTYGWDKYVGRNGVKIGIDEFGASAPAKDLYKHFGVTKENLVSQIKAKL